MLNYTIYIDEKYNSLRKRITKQNPDVVAVLVDQNTRKHCLPHFSELLKIKDLFIIEIAAGEKHKTIETTQSIWEQMSKAGMSRKSMLLNLGGGVIGDMGGFAASTYMRGMTFIQVPTTLLSMVDASVGGKLGIDFGGFKNFIGLFENPYAVWIDTQFLSTLSENEMKSGYAEVLKHSLIANKKLWKKLSTSSAFPTSWTKLINENVTIKNTIVAADPYESDIRKILNYGHTVGHAIETYFLTSPTPLLHGYAIAMGMQVENHIAFTRNILSEKHKDKINAFLSAQYPCTPITLTEGQIESILYNLTKDKKNSHGSIQMSLLEKPGSCTYDVTVEIVEVRQALVDSGVLNLSDF